MKVAEFSTQDFERQFFMQANIFMQANKNFRHELLFHKEALHQETESMAKRFPAVCAFINDKLDAATLSALVAGGTRLVALRPAGYNNADLPAADKLKITLMRVSA
jgi:D-lactate dehydrogenase